MVAHIGWVIRVRLHDITSDTEVGHCPLYVAYHPNKRLQLMYKVNLTKWWMNQLASPQQESHLL